MTLSTPPAGFRLESLKEQERSGFKCGTPSLDEYLHRQAGQDAKRRLAAVFLLVAVADGSIAGYYTLSSTTIVPQSLPESLRKRLPKYDAFPATLIGRLAVDEAHKGKGLGKWLLVDACVRALLHSAEVASLAVVVDSLDESARRFYEAFGFAPLDAKGRRLFLPMQTIARLAEE